MSDDRPATPARPDRAGWFDDPDEPEQLRYFDGILWTKHTTPRQTTWSRPEPVVTEPSPSAVAAGQSTPVQAAPGTAPYGQPPQNPYAPAQPPTAYPPAQPGPYGYPQHARPGPLTEDGAPLASLPARFAAWLLDSVLTWTIGLILGGWMLWRGLGNYPQVVADALQAGTTDATALAQQIQFELVWIGAFAVLQMVIGVAYHTIFLSRTGATPGKAVVGISVRLVERPGVLSLTDALRRSVLRPVLWLFTYTPVLSLFAMPLSVLDGAYALWDPRRQTLHDKIGRTVVVQGRQQRAPRQ
ncbi:MAG: RDD family protein [Dermatophilaceae bacterium]